MAENLVKPVLEDLIRQGDADGNFTFVQPVYVQIVKFRVVEGQRFIRVSDSVWSIGLYSHELDESFLEMFRIVKITNFTIKRISHDATSRMFLEILGWEDQGPSYAIKGHPKSLKMNDVQKWVTKHEIPIRSSQDDEEPQPAVLANHNISNSSAGSAAPSRTTSNISGGGAPNRPNSNSAITIEAISPYIHNWRILARCTKKSDIREFNYKDRAETGRMFKVTLTDETGDIEATGFSDAVDTYYNRIDEGHQYYFSKLAVRQANKRFSTSGHDFDLAFTRDTVIEPAYDTNVKLPSVFFKFVTSLADLSNHEVNSNVDAIGVVTQVFDSQTITSKTSNIPYTKRDIELVDDSSTLIKLTVWGADAENFSAPTGTILAVKGARLSDFNGVSLSATRQSKIVTDLDEPRAHKLKGWYEAIGSVSNNFTRVSKDGSNGISGDSRRDERVTIRQITNNNLGRSEKAEYFQLKARIAQIFNRTVAYPACTIGDCRKKVIQEGDVWRCEKCNQTMDEPQWRYVLSMLLSDPTSPDLGLSVSVFDQVGRILYGDRALEFHNLHALAEPQDFNRDLAKAMKVIQGDEYLWTIQGNIERYQGEERPRFQAISAVKVDPITEGEKLLGEMGF